MEKTITVAGQVIVVKEFFYGGLTERAGEVAGLKAQVLDKKGRLCSVFVYRRGMSFHFVKNGNDLAGNSYDIIGNRVKDFDAEILEALTVEYMSYPTCRRNTLELAAKPKSRRQVTEATQRKMDAFQAWAARAAEEPKAPIAAEEVAAEEAPAAVRVEMVEGKPVFIQGEEVANVSILSDCWDITTIVRCPDGKQRYVRVNPARGALYWATRNGGVPYGRQFRLVGTESDKIPVSIVNMLRDFLFEHHAQDLIKYFQRRATRFEVLVDELEAHELAAYQRALDSFVKPQPDPDPEKAEVPVEGHYSQEELAEIWGETQAAAKKTLEHKAAEIVRSTPRFEVRRWSYGRFPIEFGVWDTKKASWTAARIQTEYKALAEVAETMNEISARGGYPAVFLGAVDNRELCFVVSESHTQAAETIARQLYDRQHAVSRLLRAGGPEVRYEVWVRELGVPIEKEPLYFEAVVRAGGETLQPEIKVTPRVDSRLSKV